jgi:hypothetical protein
MFELYLHYCCRESRLARYDAYDATPASKASELGGIPRRDKVGVTARLLNVSGLSTQTSSKNRLLVLL